MMVRFLRKRRIEDNEVMVAQFVGDDPQSWEPESAWFSDGWHDWTWHDGEWYTSSDGGWIAYSEMKPWIDIDEVGAFDSNLGKELQELYVAYDQKLRTFRESREAMHQKGKNRVFLPKW